jgi:hypothetical protein
MTNLERGDLPNLGDGEFDIRELEDSNIGARITTCQGRRYGTTIIKRDSNILRAFDCLVGGNDYARTPVDTT